MIEGLLVSSTRNRKNQGLIPPKHEVFMLLLGGQNENKKKLQV